MGRPARAPIDRNYSPSSIGPMHHLRPGRTQKGTGMYVQSKKNRTWLRLLDGKIRANVDLDRKRKRPRLGLSRGTLTQ